MADMKQRLPRRYKKQVKKIVSAQIAMRSVQCSLVIAQYYTQMLTLSATPRSLDQDKNSFIAEKALAVVELTKDSAGAISKIMSEKPNSWRDFLR